MYVLMIGVAAVAALAVARLVTNQAFRSERKSREWRWRPSTRKVCDKPRQVAKPDQDNCLRLLDDLQVTHERAVLADTGEI
jgi:hypothetical protein